MNITALILIASLALSLMLMSLVLLAMRLVYVSRVRKVYDLLDAPCEPSSTYDPAMTAGLPEAARRYFAHALAPGTPVYRRAEVSMAGLIRHDGAKEDVKAAIGLVVAARRGFLAQGWQYISRWMRLESTEYFLGVAGRADNYMYGLIPAASEKGPGTDASMTGRYVAETLMLPTALLPSMGAVWREVDENTASVRLPLDGVADGAVPELTISVGRTGRLMTAALLRHPGDGKPPDARELFGLLALEESTFSGVTIPTKITAGWGLGTGGFKEAHAVKVVAAAFR